MIPKRLSKSLVKGLTKSGQFYNPWGMMGYGMSPWGMMGYGMPSWGMVPSWGNMGQTGQQGGPNPWQAYAQRQATEANLWAQRPDASYTVDFRNDGGKIVAVITDEHGEQWLIPTESSSIRGAIKAVLDRFGPNNPGQIFSFAINTPHGVSVYRVDSDNHTSQMTIPKHMLNTNYGRHMLSMAIGDENAASELLSARTGRREAISRIRDPRTGEYRWSVNVNRVQGLDEKATESYSQNLSDLYAAAHELRMDRVRGGVLDPKKREELQNRVNTAIESLRSGGYINDETAKALQQHAQSYIQGDERFGIDYSVDRFKRLISGIAENPYLYHRDTSEFIRNPEEYERRRQQRQQTAAGAASTAANIATALGTATATGPLGAAVSVANAARSATPTTTTPSPTTTTPAPTTTPQPQTIGTTGIQSDNEPKKSQARYDKDIPPTGVAHSFTEDVDRMLADRLAIIVEDLIKLPTV
jgi:hypothetical protein